MYVVSVTVMVKPDGVQAFMEATRANASATRREPGNVRFDVLQCEDDPSRFLLYEVYRQKADFASHQQTAHYLQWRETVNPLMAQPRQGVKHRNVYPEDAEW